MYICVYVVFVIQYDQAYSRPAMPGGDKISGRADPAQPFLGLFPLSSPSIASIFSSLPSPLFLSSLFSPQRSGRQVQLGGLGSALSFLNGVRGAAPTSDNKSILVCIQVTKCVWQQPFLFFMQEPKCSSAVSEPKWTSVQTTLYDWISLYTAVTCMCGTGVGGKS